jgi:hypothetical protein
MVTEDWWKLSVAADALETLKLEEPASKHPAALIIDSLVVGLHLQPGQQRQHLMR